MNLSIKQSQIHPGNSRESLKWGWTIPVIKLKEDRQGRLRTWTQGQSDYDPV